ncbi:MAG: hypothetical protein ABI042_13720 [Verrucomicrobiota bacterium]
MLATLFLAGILAGCVLSFYPLFPEKDIVFNPAFVGVWKTNPSPPTSSDSGVLTEGTFSVTRFIETGKNYLIQTEIKKEPPGRFLAQLGNIGTNLFLQIVPQQPDDIHPKRLYGGHFIQGYSFWKITIDGDKLRLAEMNYLWIEAMAKQNKLEIKYVQRDGGFIVLTASTQELQTFIAKYVDSPHAFPKTIEFMRQK